MNKIKWIYFDVGGVAIKDFSGTNKWQELLGDLGVPVPKQHIVEKWWAKHIKPRVNLDLNLDDQLSHFETALNISLPQNYSMVNDMITRFEPNQTLWPLFDQLQNNHKIGLLTNMYPGMFDKLNQARLLPPHTWTQVIDSSVVLAQKPNADIYHLAQEKANVPHNEILFIDNVQENLEVPKQLDWHTFWYDSTDYEGSTDQLIKFIQNHT